MIGNGNPLLSTSYTSASAPEPIANTNAGAAAMIDAVFIDVVFIDSATAGEISATLRNVGVEIVSGPSGVGRYRVRVAGDAAELDQADLAAITARLKAGPTPIALFAELVL